MRLLTKRGEFYLDKNFGSLLYKLNDTPCDEKEVLALQYARQAVEEMEQICITKCTIVDNQIKISLTVKDVEKEVTIDL